MLDEWERTTPEVVRGVVRSERFNNQGGQSVGIGSMGRTRPAATSHSPVSASWRVRSLPLRNDKPQRLGRDYRATGSERLAEDG